MAICLTKRIFASYKTGIVPYDEGGAVIVLTLFHLKKPILYLTQPIALPYCNKIGATAFTRIITPGTGIHWQQAGLGLGP